MSSKLKAMANMRRSLLWVLLITVVASLISILWPPNPVGKQIWAAERVGIHVASAEFPRRALLGPDQLRSAEPVTPRDWPLPTDLGAASRDPFFLTDPGSEPTRTRAVTSPPVVVDIAPLEVAVPLISYRYLGNFRSPDGQVKVFLQGPDGAAIEVRPNQAVEGGFVVDAVNAEGVLLRHAAQNLRVLVPAPRAVESP